MGPLARNTGSEGSTAAGRNTPAAVPPSINLQPQSRLLTFSGPGGRGKARLAVQVAAEVLDMFPDGVFFSGAGSDFKAHPEAQSGAED